MNIRVLQGITRHPGTVSGDDPLPGAVSLLRLLHGTLRAHP